MICNSSNILYFVGERVMWSTKEWEILAREAQMDLWRICSPFFTLGLYIMVQHIPSKEDGANLVGAALVYTGGEATVFLDY